jgi:hypothetical protein
MVGLKTGSAGFLYFSRVLTTRSPDWAAGAFKVTQERARPVFANGSRSVRRVLSVFRQFESYSYTQGGN